MVSLLPSGLIIGTPSSPTSDPGFIRFICHIFFFFLMKRFGTVGEGHGENLEHPWGSVDASKAAPFQHNSVEYSAMVEMFCIWPTQCGTTVATEHLMCEQCHWGTEFSVLFNAALTGIQEKRTRFWFDAIQVMWSQVRLNFLSLSFLKCKVGVIMVVTHVIGPGTWSVSMPIICSHAQSVLRH